MQAPSFQLFVFIRFYITQPIFLCFNRTVRYLRSTHESPTKFHRRGPPPIPVIGCCYPEFKLAPWPKNLQPPGRSFRADRNHSIFGWRGFLRNQRQRPRTRSFRDSVDLHAGQRLIDGTSNHDRRIEARKRSGCDRGGSFIMDMDDKTVKSRPDS